MATRQHHMRLDFSLEHFVPSPDLFMASPSGRLSFGRMPRLVNRSGEVIDEGEIRLRYGEHWGVNHGYGVHHILQAHPQLSRNGLSSIVSVTQFVASIIQPKADIHCEFASLRGQHRPVVIRRPHGQVVLAPKRDKALGLFYSVVTAIPSTKAKGPRIGAL
jgi:hypothetical protein